MNLFETLFFAAMVYLGIITAEWASGHFGWIGGVFGFIAGLATPVMILRFVIWVSKRLEERGK
jgi:hypothetical protein